MWYGENTTVRLAYEHMEYLVPFDRGTIIDSRNGKPVNTPRDRRFDEAYNATRGDQTASLCRSIKRSTSVGKAR